jgi:hypothetical protein
MRFIDMRGLLYALSYSSIASLSFEVMSPHEATPHGMCQSVGMTVACFRLPISKALLVACVDFDQGGTLD